MYLETIKFAIRDDDISYFTTPQELEDVYSFIEEGAISLSVVPFTVPYHGDVSPYGAKLDYRCYAIGKNAELTKYLREKVKNGRFDILLHGYSHEYKKLNNVWIPEMLWKPEKQLEKELSVGKKYLENLFEHTIKIFVSPNNKIDRKGIKVINKLGLDLSGIIAHNDRPVEIKYLMNYVYRWMYRSIYGIQYGGLLDYRGHKELTAYSVDTFDRLRYEYEMCKENKNPFVIYTHYWNLLRNNDEMEKLRKIVLYVLNDGVELVPLSSLFI